MPWINGWGYQLSESHQGAGIWSTTCRKWHINGKELLVLYLFVQKFQPMWNVAVYFHMNSQVAVQFISRRVVTLAGPALCLKVTAPDGHTVEH